MTDYARNYKEFLFRAAAMFQRSSQLLSATSKSDIFYLVIITGIAAVMYLLCSFSVFVTSDELRYAIGFKSLAEHNQEPFNYEMSFGYYLALRPFVSSLSSNYLPLFLNALNSLAAILLLVPLYLLVKSLFSTWVAFWTAIFMVFSPSYWMLSRYGHPAIPALLFFFSSMVIFNLAISSKENRLFLLTLSIILVVCALLIRADILLVLLTPIGIVLYRKKMQKQDLCLVTTFYLSVIICYMIMKWFAVGYMLHPSGGTLYGHLHERLLSYQYVIKSIIKNSALFVFSILPLLSVCLFLSLNQFVRTRQWRLLVLICLWCIPSLIFLPFWGMDTSRLTVPILAPILLSIVSWIDCTTPPRFRQMTPPILLIVAHLTSIMISPILIGIYPFKIAYHNKPIASVPMGSIFTDYLVRRSYLQDLDDITGKVTQRTDRDIIVITDGTHVVWYQYKLLTNRGSPCALKTYKENIDVLSCPTPQNHFYIFDSSLHSSIEPLAHIQADETFKNAMFHITPFIIEGPQETLFITSSEFALLLDKDVFLIDRYRQILR